MATTSQLLLLLRPQATRFVLSTPLKSLREQVLVDHVVLPQSNRTRAWFLTPEAARLTRDWPPCADGPVPDHLIHRRFPAHPAHPDHSPPGRQRARPGTPATGPTWLRWYPVYPRILEADEVWIVRCTGSVPVDRSRTAGG
ncbi:hypothetical protein [Streptomyces sp. NPDC056468]|uniref:hypothetical protein n=1 Tax=Streptomyces sp. NPDC056468 TaxID=3345830 RepID=UPI00369A7DDC